jgi:hypothetical protein
LGGDHFFDDFLNIFLLNLIEKANLDAKRQSFRRPGGMRGGAVEELKRGFKNLAQDFGKKLVLIQT